MPDRSSDQPDFNWENVELPPPPDPAENGPSEEIVTAHAWYHRIVWAATVGLGLAGFSLGLFASLVALEKVSAKRVRGAIIMPLFAGGCAAGLGLSLTCAVAPTSFLTGPLGKRWMKIIGTENVLGARAACLAFAVMACVLLGGIAWIIAHEKAKNAESKTQRADADRLTSRGRRGDYAGRNASNADRSPDRVSR